MTSMSSIPTTSSVYCCSRRWCLISLLIGLQWYSSVAHITRFHLRTSNHDDDSHHHHNDDGGEEDHDHHEEGGNPTSNIDFVIVIAAIGICVVSMVVSMLYVYVRENCFTHTHEPVATVGMRVHPRSAPTGNMAVAVPLSANKVDT